MTITWTEANRLMDAMATIYAKTYVNLTNQQPAWEDVERITKETFLEYCEDMNITEVEIEDNSLDSSDDVDDLPDDVDESNYNPFIGCDEFEIDDEM